MKKIVSLLLITFTMFSCIPTQKLKYSIDDKSLPDKYKYDRSEKTIQPYDYLYIKIYSLDEKTNQIFNSDNQTSFQSEELISYSVNSSGYINFPFIGDIFVKDLDIDAARVKIEKELNKYLTNISVRMRFVGNKITVIGEVNHPGNQTFYDEKITVFQALGLAGDIADFGDKTKVTLVREKNNEIKYIYLDLTKKNIVESEYYYLLPNDILIVDPVRAKYRGLQNFNTVYLIFATISTAIQVYLLTK
jgi:polysaccharide biosynthesis/export protein